MARTLKSEALDFTAHASSSFVILWVAHWLGAYWTEESALTVAWACGFIREFTEWQDGGKHPFTPLGLLDQLGWVVGGVIFVLTVL